MNNELKHYGVLGMKWGVRRYQPYPNDSSSDGRFLNLRKQRKENRITKKVDKRIDRVNKEYDRIMSSRENVSKRREEKDQKRIDRKPDGTWGRYKAEARREYRRNDYNTMTRAYTRGNKATHDMLENYKHTRLKALNDSSYRKTKEYKKAGREYLSWLWSVQNYGYSYAAVNEAAKQLLKDKYPLED